MLVSAEEVRRIFQEALWDKGHGEYIEVVGIYRQHKLSLKALETLASQIGDVVANLKAEVFVKDTGEEYISLLSARYDRNGVRWAGEAALVEDLLILGMGAEKLARLEVPREIEARFFPEGSPLYRLTILPDLNG